MNYKKLLILGVFASTAANASTATCPSTVKAGTPLIVSATVTNDDCNDAIVIKNSVLSLTGSNAGTLSLQGPFVTPLFATLIPAATCALNNPSHPEYGSHVVNSGTHTFSNLIVINPVPAGMKGKLALVTAGFLDDQNNLIMAGICNITVK
jgi:hypothetical protein